MLSVSRALGEMPAGCSIVPTWWCEVVPRPIHSTLPQSVSRGAVSVQIVFILDLFMVYPFRLELGVLLGVAYRTGASRRHLPRLVCGWVGAYLGGAGGGAYVNLTSDLKCDLNTPSII